MSKAGILTKPQDIRASLQSIVGESGNVQASFNQGKFTYQSAILAVEDGALRLDFSGFEETSLMELFDFCSPILVVYFIQGVRHHFTAKAPQLSRDRVELRMGLPSAIVYAPGRASERHDIPEGAAHAVFGDKRGPRELPVREMSLGGMSFWADGSHGLFPHMALKDARVVVDGQSIPCPIQIARVVYNKEGPPGLDHLVSCQFQDLTDRDRVRLEKLLATFPVSKN